MSAMERFFYVILFAVVFGLAAYTSMWMIENLDKNNELINKDMMVKASVEEHIGTEKEYMAVDAEYDATTGDAKYVTVKGSDVLYDLINTIDSVSDKQIKAGKVSIKIKVTDGYIIPSSDEVLKIKNKKSSVLKTLDTRIRKTQEYKRVYYYSTDLDITELVYEY